MRLIDADEALDAIDNRIRQIGYEDFVLVLSIRQAVRDVKPVDAVPVVRGRWETVEDWDGDEHYMCSVCGAEFVLIEGDPDDNDYLYCPHCGADMRKDGDNHDGS